MPLADPKSHISGSVSNVGDSNPRPTGSNDRGSGANRHFRPQAPQTGDHCCRHAQRPMANPTVSSLVPVDRHARASWHFARSLLPEPI